MTFEEALTAAKAGSTIWRPGYHQEGIWVQNSANKTGDHVLVVGDQGKSSTAYHPTHRDLFASDWEIVPA